MMIKIIIIICFFSGIMFLTDIFVHVIQIDQSCDRNESILSPFATIAFVSLRGKPIYWNHVVTKIDKRCQKKVETKRNNNNKKNIYMSMDYNRCFKT